MLSMRSGHSQSHQSQTVSSSKMSAKPVIIFVSTNLLYHFFFAILAKFNIWKEDDDPMSTRFYREDFD